MSRGGCRLSRNDNTKLRKRVGGPGVKLPHFVLDFFDNRVAPYCERSELPLLSARRWSRYSLSNRCVT